MAAEFPVEEYLKRVQARVDFQLRKLLEQRTAGEPARLSEALAWAVLAPGKRLRPALVLASAEACGGEVDDASLAMRFAVALELVHTYSLVHDDLPCMDDDDLRRGRLTVHKKYDEATAVLVGDGLQSLAFKHLLAGNEPVAAKLGQILASNAYLMVEGQALDLEAETRPFTEGEVSAMQAAKTGALVAAACVGGAMAASGSGQNFYPVGHKLGLAFQIADDLLDLTGSQEQAGKRVGKDAAAGKATLPALVGVEEARRRARAYCDEALAQLAPLGENADALKAIACYIVARTR